MLRLLVGIEIEAIINSNVMKNYNISQGSYHHGMPMNAFWDVESDSSLHVLDKEKKSSHMGVEFVSAPIWSYEQLELAINSLFLSIGFTSLEDNTKLGDIIHFNSTTGCHIHINIVEDRFLERRTRTSNRNCNTDCIKPTRNNDDVLLVNSVLVKYDNVKSIKTLKEDMKKLGISIDMKNDEYLVHGGDSLTPSARELYENNMDFIKTNSIESTIAGLGNSLISNDIHVVKSSWTEYERLFGRSSYITLNNISDFSNLTLDKLLAIEKLYDKRCEELFSEKTVTSWRKYKSRGGYAEPISIEDQIKRIHEKISKSTDYSRYLGCFWEIDEIFNSRSSSWYLPGSRTKTLLYDNGFLSPYKEDADKIMIKVGSGKGIEWRAFHLIGSETIGEVKKRLLLAYKVLSEVLLEAGKSEVGKLSWNIDFGKIVNIPVETKKKENVIIKESRYPKRRNRYRKYKIVLDFQPEDIEYGINNEISKDKFFQTGGQSLLDEYEYIIRQLKVVDNKLVIDNVVYENEIKLDLEKIMDIAIHSPAPRKRLEDVLEANIYRETSKNKNHFYFPDHIPNGTADNTTIARSNTYSYEQSYVL